MSVQNEGYCSARDSTHARAMLVVEAGPLLSGTGSQSHLATAAPGNADPGMAGGELALGKLWSPPPL